VREDRGVWNSFTKVPNLTNLIVITDRRLLAGTVGCRASGLSDNDYLILICVRVLMWAGGEQLDEELLCGFDSRWYHWNFLFP
jgi:hypothetical protein